MGLGTHWQKATFMPYVHSFEYVEVFCGHFVMDLTFGADNVSMFHADIIAQISFKLND